ncbi:CsbD family protein [uncultured Methylobacterium sp.]|uniref:CsbD family protein n=1 Tax=uncultured Methylobacterium sp. TaxID=157278 RepID=UPI00261AB2FA|nr:CsbD family protein [uncultured Methylobacterium sp.]
MNRDQIEGGLRHLKGRGQTAIGAVAGRVRPQAEGAFNQVVGGAQYVYGRGRRTAEELSRDGAALADDIGERGRHLYDETRSRSRDLYDETRSRGRHVAGRIRHRTEARPAETLLLVAGLAFVTGWLVRGRR